jgi:glycosyltransferase involved in cell wall biosynthesis
LPAYCKGFDVGLIPFPINRVTLHSNPLKVREYLAAGLPVVSTAIPEVQALGGCRIASDANSFVHHVREALKNPGPSAARSETMRPEDWQFKLREVCAHL